MNERIRELYEQARLQAKSIDADIDPKGWMDLYHQKFAELIVRECAGIYDKIDNGNLHMGTDDYLEALDKTFFGVEE